MLNRVSHRSPDRCEGPSILNRLNGVLTVFIGSRAINMLLYYVKDGVHRIIDLHICFASYFEHEYILIYSADFIIGNTFSVQPKGSIVDESRIGEDYYWRCSKILFDLLLLVLSDISERDKNKSKHLSSYFARIHFLFIT